MKRPKITVNKLLVYGPALFIAVPMVLTGFMSMPGDKHQAAYDNAPVDIDALMKSVMELNRKKQHQKAIDMLIAAIDKHKDDPLLRTLLVQTFDLFLEDEIRRGQKEIDHNRHNKGAYNRVAGALELLGDNFRAMEVLINGIGNNPESAELWMKIAKLELNANRDMEALDVFKEVIRLDDKNSDAYNNAAYLLVHSRDCDAKGLKEAEHFATRAHRLEPRNPQYLDTLAEVQFRKGDKKTALSLMEEAIKLAPKNDAFKNQLQRFQNDTPILAK